MAGWFIHKEKEPASIAGVENDMTLIDACLACKSVSANED
jgi:hypothetical protein